MQSRVFLPCRTSSPDPLTWLSISGSSSWCKRLEAPRAANSAAAEPGGDLPTLWAKLCSWDKSWQLQLANPGVKEMCQPLTAIKKCQSSLAARGNSSATNTKKYWQDVAAFVESVYLTKMGRQNRWTTCKQLINFFIWICILTHTTLKTNTSIDTLFIIHIIGLHMNL